MNFNDYFTRGVAFYKDRNYEPAIKNFEAALKLDPSNTQLRNMIAELKLAARDRAQANFYGAQVDKLKRQLAESGVW